jgi:two-component system LytT family sensor kinase
MHHAAITDPYIAGQLIGFTTGLVITLLLFALVLRARRLPGTPVANALLVLCALAWNAGGLANTIAQALSATKETNASLIASAVQFTGAAVWPIPLLAIWRPFAVRSWQRRVAFLLLFVAVVDGSFIVLALWAAALTGFRIASPIVMKELTSFNASLLALGAVVSLANRPASRAMWFSSLATLLGVFATTLGTILVNVVAFRQGVEAAVIVLSEQATLLILLGGFFLFARFRFADLFIRHSLRVLLVGLTAAILGLLWRADLAERLPDMTAFPQASRFFAGCVLTAAWLLVFTALDRRLGDFVNRRIVRAPNYQRAARDLRERLRHLHTDGEVLAAAQDCARQILDLADVHGVAADRLPTALWPADLLDGEIIEIDARSPLAALLGLPDAELLVPVRAGGGVRTVLAVSPQAGRRGFVTHEIDYLRIIASQCGARLDSLGLARDMAERHNRESLLKQQVTEAELRALRAQINPHFLFNALNTLADLIVTAPAAAEAVTLQLARVFRHVLTHSGRPVTSVGDEIEFLRAYVQIEGARFGGRLHVDIDVHPEVARHPIPSLILQPVVENALKHGLAPKLGAGHLWVSARAQNDRVCLQVEDDGIGIGKPNGRASDGIGLANIAKRLAVAYDGQATLALAPRAAGGTCVTIYLPRSCDSARRDE